MEQGAQMLRDQERADLFRSMSKITFIPDYASSVTKSCVNEEI